MLALALMAMVWARAGEGPAQKQEDGVEDEVSMESFERTADEEDDNPDKPVVGKGAPPADSGVIDDWVNYMHGYESNVLVSFHLKGSRSQVFYEEVRTGQLIRGAFFAAAEGVQASIDFKVLTPQGDELVSVSSPEKIFHFHARESGVYQFVSTNSAYFGSKLVTFTVGVDEVHKVPTDKLDSTESRVARLVHLAKDAQVESKYLWTRERERLRHYASAHERVVHFAIAQFCVYICVSAFQIYYVKGLLSHRRVL